MHGAANALWIPVGMRRTTLCVATNVPANGNVTRTSDTNQAHHEPYNHQSNHCSEHYHFLPFSILKTKNSSQY
jgi:hypothetical protein